eukprot:m.362082 g.362082  ORF g.362082 m.362082 type:complete len:142 (-) comp20077_c0_seq1:104-529(-)
MAANDPVGEKQAKLLAITQQIHQLSMKANALEREIKSEQDIQDVNDHFMGRDELDILQDMVRNLTEEQDPPTSKRGCRELLLDVYINIFDYVEGKYHLACDTKRELRRRCQLRGHFPLDKAKSEQLRGLLQFLYKRKVDAD